MRLPGWLDLDESEAVAFHELPDRYVLRLRVKWWHPGFWVALIRHLMTR